MMKNDRAGWAWVIVTAVGMAALGGLSGCGEQAKTAQAAPTRAPVKVIASAVVTRPIERTVVVSGTIFGEEEATISAKSPGRVERVLVDLGDVVKPGQPLVQIERRDYELALAERRTAAQALLAKLGLTEMPAEGTDLSQVPTVVRAKSEEANAKARLDRVMSLRDDQRQLISEQDFADIETQWRVAAQNSQVELLTAQATLAEVRTQMAAMAIASQQLDDTLVAAPNQMPLTYRVAARRVSTGEIVSAGQALFRLVAVDRVKFRGSVPERFAGVVRVGAVVRLAIDARSEPFEARVARVSPQVDQATRAFEVEIEADNPSGLLKPGSFARASIVTGTDDAAAFVPATAVVEFAGVQRVYVVEDGKAMERRVGTGERVEADGVAWIEVVEPAPLQGRVIADPAGLSNGVPVIE